MAYLEGWLRRAENEPQGEHTGYMLEIEVDMSAVEDVEGLVGDQLAVTGDVEIVDYPERGKIMVFKVSSSAVLEEDEPEEPEEATE
ncbi:MAG TPA: hypothetical protein VFE21_02850 [Rubrobacteraceae bacterium]|nr:hypothetical protein [Rubrobacteraceae bacterium]